MASSDDGGDWGKNLALGLEIAVGVGLGYFVGNWFDKRYGTAPWGMMVAIAIGFSAGLYSLIKVANRENKK